MYDLTSSNLSSHADDVGEGEKNEKVTSITQYNAVSHARKREEKKEKRERFTG